MHLLLAALFLSAAGICGKIFSRRTSWQKESEHNFITYWEQRNKTTDAYELMKLTDEYLIKQNTIDQKYPNIRKRY